MGESQTERAKQLTSKINSFCFCKNHQEIFCLLEELNISVTNCSFKDVCCNLAQL